MYELEPLGAFVVVEPIKSKDVKNYTGKTLVDVETTGMDVLQYGKVFRSYSAYPSTVLSEGEIILYEKLASHKTNFGEPRLVLVDVDHIIAKLGESNADQTS